MIVEYDLVSLDGTRFIPVHNIASVHTNKFLCWQYIAHSCKSAEDKVLPCWGQDLCVILHRFKVKYILHAQADLLMTLLDDDGVSVLFFLPCKCLITHGKEFLQSQCTFLKSFRRYRFQQIIENVHLIAFNGIFRVRRDEYRCRNFACKTPYRFHTCDPGHFYVGKNNVWLKTIDQLKSFQRLGTAGYFLQERETGSLGFSGSEVNFIIINQQVFEGFSHRRIVA